MRKSLSAIAIVLLVIASGAGFTYSVLIGDRVSEYSLFFDDVPETTVVTDEHQGIARLAGRVVHAGGEGVHPARIALSGDRLDSVRFVFTDSEGRFAFEDVPLNGSYRVTVRANGLVFERPSYAFELHSAVEDLVFFAEPYK